METLNKDQSITPSTKQLLDLEDVRAITGFSATTIYKHVKDGIFPQPKKCGRSTRWRLADIQAYINS
ncbi:MULTISPECIES: helix-turn-helix transcriptional regulator [Rodentibacter]|uniref:Transcriptional regulator n=1 Tax=Rodentibacter ratti TaxID=1906745 RepID=A0A1V3L805_9PAST|nr:MULTISPECIES: helix-turn-helix domain-containing protein [Rodentibacter]OOF56373.1 transcriptional regulator [Rodentibacter genomosp. 2]OOF64704.1 transcriptional regulator [Rodentibacter sp. Ppn85]OOF85710.1 transcriptional regulator [Rodentibacter ratti]